MRFQWDRPYLVDHSKFADRFGADLMAFATRAQEAVVCGNQPLSGCSAQTPPRPRSRSAGVSGRSAPPTADGVPPAFVGW